MARPTHPETRHLARVPRLAMTACLAVVLGIACCGIVACEAVPDLGDGSSNAGQSTREAVPVDVPEGDAASDAAAEAPHGSSSAAAAVQSDDATEESQAADEAQTQEQKVEEARARLDMTEDYREVFYHGEKPAQYQKFIVLHDTEGDSDPESVISWWAGNGNLVASHFVVGKDGHIVQCVPLDTIAHHAGFGDTGHNDLYGVTDESRDDKAGTTPIGDWAADYGMNSYSIGIEMVHVGGSGDYPEAQLQAVDDLIAYIDACYGFESQIIDHKAWRSGNSDTSEEFAGYLANYQTMRKHA